MAEDTQEWRRERLRALARKLGGNAPLGRALGFRDGAFVGQMLTGTRPITEKTIEAAERLQGCRGWFALPSGVSARGSVFEELSPEERGFMENFRVLLDSDRARIIQDVARRAAELREYLDQHGKPGVPLVAKQRHAPVASEAPQTSTSKAPHPRGAPSGLPG